LTGPEGVSPVSVRSLVTSGTDLYVCADFLIKDRKYPAGYWKNGAWVPLTDSLSSAGSGIAESLLVAGPDVYVGGRCGNGTSIDVPGYWKNGAWVGLKNPKSNYANFTDGIALIGPSVCVLGYLTDYSSGVAGIWKDGTWTELSDPRGRGHEVVANRFLSTEAAAGAAGGSTVATAAAPSVAIGASKTSQEKLASGAVRLTFAVQLSVTGAPLSYDYHWERSDGSKTSSKTAKVEAGTTSLEMRETWQLGPNAARKALWEELFVDLGESHLSSERIQATLPE
jgi:hypothetical protein